jgi:hypothetical protein
MNMQQYRFLTSDVSDIVLDRILDTKEKSWLELVGSKYKLQYKQFIEQLHYHLIMPGVSVCKASSTIDMMILTCRESNVGYRDFETFVNACLIKACDVYRSGRLLVS